MRQLMAGAAQGREVFVGVGPALVAGRDVVDFQKAGVGAARRLAAVLIAGQYPPAGTGRDGGFIGTVAGGDAGVTGQFFVFGRGEFGFAAAGGDVGFLAVGAMVHVDLGVGFFGAQAA